MAIPSISASSISTLRAAQSGITQSAETIARATTETLATGATSATSDLPTALVELKLYTAQGQAAVKIINAMDELLGALVDEKV